MQPLVYFRDLGLIDYKEAWDFQETIFKNTIQEKIQIRNGDTTIITKNYLLFCEHPCKPAGEEMEMDFKSFKEALLVASNLTTKSKRFSPSKISPAV